MMNFVSASIAVPVQTLPKSFRSFSTVCFATPVMRQTVEKEGIKVRVRDEDEDEQPAKKNKSTSFDTEQLAAAEPEEAPEPIEDTENIGQEEPGEAEA